MKKIELSKLAIAQLRAVIPLAEPHERPAIRAILRRQMIRLALLILQQQLETAIDGPFDHRTSRKLDAIRILLDD